MDKNKVNYIVYVLIFCAVISGIGGFYLGKSFGERTIVEKENDKTTEVDKKDDKKESDIDKELEKLGKELVKKTSIAYLDYRFYFYGNDGNLNYEKMDNKVRLESALSSMPESQIVYNENSLDDTNCSEENGCYVEKVKKADFEEAYYNLFGTDKKIVYEEFSVNVAEYCKLVNSEIICYYDASGDDSSTKGHLRYDSVEQNGEELYVYTKLLMENIDGDVYSDLLYSNKIGSYEEDEISENELFDKFGDKASKYKLTFKKDTNGNWYWVSTEALS